MHKRRRSRDGKIPKTSDAAAAYAAGPVKAAIAATHAAFGGVNAVRGAEHAANLGRLCDEVTPYPENTAQCAGAIQKIRTLFRQWTQTWLMRQRGLSSAAADTAGAFYTFVSGSYRLNVYSASTDIDMVLVTTAAIPRAAVFTDFVRVLNTHADISQLQVLADIRVPLISATVDGQDLDIMTVHLRSDTLPARAPDLLHDYEWMNGLDDASVLCLNGPRVTELLLEHYCNPDVAGAVIQPGAFCTAVRYLRLWARQRAVYGNKNGFLGGVNIALLVAWAADVLAAAGFSDGGTAPQTAAESSTAAHVSQFLPLNAAHLVAGVFRLLHAWDFSEPIVLQRFTRQPCPLWLQRLDTDPDAANDTGGGAYAAMHLSTPCYPRSNTLFAATRHTVKVLQHELQRAAALVESTAWAALVAPVARDMVRSVQQWLQIVIEVPDTARGRLWQGFVEAQIRHLVYFLSTEELAIAKFRALPTWVPLADEDSDTAAGTAAGLPKLLRKAMFIAADPDNIVRMYTVRGSVPRALAYFVEQFLRAPTVTCRQFAGASLTMHGPVATSILNAVVLEKLVKPQCRQDALDALIAAESAAIVTEPITSVAEPAAIVTEPVTESAESLAEPITSLAEPLKRQRCTHIWGTLAPFVPEPRFSKQPKPVPKLVLTTKPSAAFACTSQRVTAVRIVREYGQWKVDSHFYVGPPVKLRFAHGPVLLTCSIPALGPPVPPNMLALHLTHAATRAAYETHIETTLTANCGTLLAKIAGKTLGCWCACPAVCHAHVIATMANRLLQLQNV